MHLSELDVAVDDIDLSSDNLWTAPEPYREAVFKKLRDERPVSFHREPDYGGMSGPGYWALTRYDDVSFASRHPDVFLSGPGVAIIDLSEEFRELLGSIIVMDRPRHTRLRLLISRGFTPRMVARVEDYVRSCARDLVRDVAPRGECDFVVDLAAKLPLRIICDMLGIPREDHEQIFHWTNAILSGGDEEYGGTIEAAYEASYGLWHYAQDLGEQRRQNPKDDITTTLMQAEVEGHQLTPQEFGSFFVLLVVAGNETTRNLIAHGMLEFTRHPDQWAALRADFPDRIDGAIEELLRWATPIIHFRRTATEDVELSGQLIKAGDKVVLWYNSANRDERNFDRPFEFDITRWPNEHVSFGAGGPHFCLGAHLARREAKVMFEELIDVLPDIQAVGEPSMLHSQFIHGIKHLQATFTASS